jgi:predicted molibdopterin-dependent oxidoreductase YjgC
MVSVENGQIVEVTGDKMSPVNRGESCVKGTQAWKYVQSHRRIHQPLIRKNGKLTNATWDEALTAVADGLRQVREQSGPDAIGCLSSSRATNEMNFLAQKLMRQVIGTNNIDSCNRT